MQNRIHCGFGGTETDPPTPLSRVGAHQMRKVANTKPVKRGGFRGGDFVEETSWGSRVGEPPVLVLCSFTYKPLVLFTLTFLVLS